jgi:amino acid transporter
MSSETLDENASVNNGHGHQHQRHPSEVPLLSQHAQPKDTPSTTAPAPLNAWSLAVIIFYAVSGGPFGIEPTIRAGGNFAAIMGFLFFPFVFSIPEALITAELGSAFHCPSGGVAWVEEAFGEGMGFMCGWLSWIAGATDNAIYPVLFLEYLESIMGYGNNDGDFLNGWTRFACIAGITVILSLLNYRGLDIVGNASILVCIIAISPFVLMTIIGIPQIVPSRWLQMPEANASVDELFDDAYETSSGPMSWTGLVTLGGILWRPYLNNLFWNLNSFDSSASFATETQCVKDTYKRGIMIALVMVIICYLVPLLVLVGATNYSQSEWVDGQIGAAAIDIGGAWLGAWTLFAAGISSLGQFEAEMSSDAFMLLGMAERGYIPKVFKYRSKYGTPTAGILVGTIVIISFGWADFGQLLELLNANYAISLVLECAAFVKLRHTHKQSKLLLFPPLYFQAARTDFASFYSASGKAVSHTDTRSSCLFGRNATNTGNTSRFPREQLVCIYLCLLLRSCGLGCC